MLRRKPRLGFIVNRELLMSTCSIHFVSMLFCVFTCSMRNCDSKLREIIGCKGNSSIRVKASLLLLFNLYDLMLFDQFV